MLVSCPLEGVVVPAPVLHLPLLHHDDVGADSVQEVLRNAKHTAAARRSTEATMDKTYALSSQSVMV